MGPRNVIRRAVRLGRGLIHSFRGESISLRAGNLTFITVTSLVPLISVAVALLQIFRADELDSHLKTLVRDLLQPGVHEGADAWIDTLLNSAGSKITGGFSFGVVLVSAVFMLRHLDAALNEVWSVSRRRPIAVSLSIYLGLVLVGPLVIALTLVGTEGLRALVSLFSVRFSVPLLELASAATMTVGLAMLYKWGPHAPVRTRSALIGGVVAGVAWDIARHTYSSVASTAFSLNPVYGALGAIPLFLVWLYISWVLILFGARLAYAAEHVDFHGNFSDILVYPRGRELIAARIAQISTQAFLSKAPAPTIRAVVQELKLPGQIVSEIVAHMSASGLVRTDSSGIAPARDPSLLSLADISTAFGGLTASRLSSPYRGPGFGQIEALWAETDRATIEQLKKISWSALANPAM